MTAADLRQQLASNLDANAVNDDAITAGIADSVRYLESDAALASLAADAYSPKWHSPWWHMTLLWELGEASRIPARVAEAMVDAINAYPVHIFPIRDEEWPPGPINKGMVATCHCAVGTMDQVLTVCGIDVDAELPWFRPWFDRYQMADGGLNCDEQAYLVADECPSSMVGTVAAFEAMIRRGNSEFTDRASRFLIERQLRLGSSTRHNAEERDAARAWPDLAFPRFYYYDTLRGLTALVRWASVLGHELPAAAIADVCTQLASRAPDGLQRVGRQPFTADSSWVRNPDNTDWVREKHASRFPLLEATSRLGDVSPALTREWRDTRLAVIALIDAGRVT